MTPAPTVRRAEAGDNLDRIDAVLDRISGLLDDLDDPTPHDTTEHHGERPTHPR